MPVTLTAAAPKAAQTTHGRAACTIGIFHSANGLSQKQVCILREIASALTQDFLREFVVPLITQRSRISLRALDWAVTNYTKKRYVSLVGSNDAVDVHSEYKMALTHYRRVNFDPFRRRTRLVFTLDGEEYKTTVGQLCFLLWAHRKGVFRFTQEHIGQIERDMNETAARCRKEPPRAGRRKELSRAQHVPCVVQQVSTRLFG